MRRNAALSFLELAAGETRSLNNDDCLERHFLSVRGGNDANYEIRPPDRRSEGLRAILGCSSARSIKTSAWRRNSSATIGG